MSDGRRLLVSTVFGNSKQQGNEEKRMRKKE